MQYIDYTSDLAIHDLVYDSALLIIYSMHKRVRVMFNTARLLHESTYKVSDTQINCEDVVKLLGVDIDYQLNFDQHIGNLCRKAGQQLNVLKRLSPFFIKT